jgi:hypothetical protein
MNKTFIKIFLIVIVVSMGLLLIIKHDTAFVKTMKIRYADGCTETYINGNMTTPECTAGRIKELQNKQGNNWLNNFNITLSNNETQINNS